MIWQTKRSIVLAFFCWFVWPCFFGHEKWRPCSPMLSIQPRFSIGSILFEVLESNGISYDIGLYLHPKDLPFLWVGLPPSSHGGLWVYDVVLLPLIHSLTMEKKHLKSSFFGKG
jgi:hypothetical protein